VSQGCTGACALGRTGVGAAIKPQEKGAGAELGEQPVPRHPALGMGFARSPIAELA